MQLRHLVAFAAVSLVVMGAAQSAFAAAPANDDRTTATALAPPQTLTGTTAEATIEGGEPSSNCDFAGVKGSVWYSLTGVKKRFAITLIADGDLDAVVDVFVRKRSQTSSVDCAATDSTGVGIVDFKAAATSDEFLIRVAQRSNSVPGTFSLNIATAADPATAPGDALPSRGVADTVNLARNPSDAWAMRMREGVSYRINLSTPSGDYCVRASLYAPRGDFDEDTPVKRLSCRGGYTLFTPGDGESGRYSILVESARKVLGNQRYHLEVAQALSDDTSPGQFWPSNSARGRLSEDGIDVIDLYNWDLRRAAIVEVKLAAGPDFDIYLLNARGRQVACGCGPEGNELISRRLSPGQYFVVVRAATGSGGGSYRLSRLVRTITHTRASFNGSGAAVTSPGSAVRMGATVTPTVGGRVVLTLQRHDPVYGWQFDRAVTGSAGGGSFSASFVPPGIGRWRVKAEFKGTRTANPSESRYAYLRVRRP